MYCEAVIMYDAQNGSKYMLRRIFKDFDIVFNKLEQLQTFTVQVGYKIREEEANGVKRVQIISTAGEIITIRRQRGI